MSGRPTSLAEWRLLPWLLTRKQVRHITGWSDAEMRKYVESKVLTRTAISGRGRYPLVDVARICNVRL